MAKRKKTQDDRSGRTPSGLYVGDDTWTGPIMLVGSLGVLAFVVWRRRVKAGEQRAAELAANPTSPMIAMGESLAEQYLPGVVPALTA